MHESQGKAFEYSYQQASVLENNSERIKDDENNKFWDNICWFYPPTRKWSLGWYLTPRGGENLHIYIWILKDFAWAQSWYISGLLFGSLAMVWSLFLLQHAIKVRNINECWAFTAQFFWLTANFIWMSGDIHDHAFPNGPQYYASRTVISGHMMEASLAFLGVYYLFVSPLKLWQPSPESEHEFNDLKIPPRFPQYFKSWRDYERIHIVFWLGKDCAWNTLNKTMWIIFVIPTFIFALDYVIQTLRVKTLVIDHAHYTALFLWVFANLVWAAGELWDPNVDDPIPVLDASPLALRTARWYSSWILVFAYVPIVVMYYMWTYAYLTAPDTLIEEDLSPIELTENQLEDHCPQIIQNPLISVKTEVIQPLSIGHVNKQGYQSIQDENGEDVFVSKV